jgi:asparagine synthase (glutamine-hydrolysing)
VTSEFSGSLTPGGELRLAGARAPEEHLGCRVLVRGYVGDRARLCDRFRLRSSDAPSDAELVAHAFRTWGPALPAHLTGEYAALVYDPRERSALLAHDALGIAPLFYRCRGAGVAFATEILQLVGEAGSETIDDEYLADFLATGFIGGERTPYVSVRRLLPGRSLWWSGGRLREIATWSVAELPPVRCRDDADYEERFRELLFDAVRSALAPDGPTWISLSGGLDSSSIACAATAAGARGTEAYSILCRTWPDANEEPWMRAVVERCGIPWHTVELESMLPFSRMPGAFHGEPTQTVLTEERLRLENALLGSHGARVMLTGHAGDAVLCASPGSSPTHLADRLFEGDPAGAFRATFAWKGAAAEGRSHAYWLLRGVTAPALDHLRGRRGIHDERSSRLPWLGRDYARTMRLRERARTYLAPRCRQPGRQALADSLWALSVATAMTPRRRMAYELRNPLLYRPLVEFMCGVPWEQKLRPRCDRYLQRRALKGVLPEIVRRRATKGNGNSAFVEGLRRSPEWIALLCDEPLLAERGIVERDGWRNAVRQASVGQTHDDKTFLAAVTLEVFLRQFREHRSP